MKFEESAGGVVITEQDGDILILIARPTNHTTWVFPKGRMNDHGQEENREETALREVEEETGAHCEIVHPLTPITYIYEWQGEKRKKTVYMYVMKYLSGDITQHDWEMEEVEWVSLEEARRRLSFKQSKQILEEAIVWVDSHRDRLTVT